MMSTRLGDIAMITSGNAAPQDKKLFVGGTHPFVRTGDVGRVHLDPCFVHPEDYLNEEGIRKLRLFPKGSILFPKSGASTLLNHRVLLGEDSYVVSHLAVLIPDSTRVLPMYLYYATINIDAGDLVDDRSYPSLKTSVLENVRINLPSLDSQNSIVSELSLLSDIIAAKKKQLLDLDSLSLSLFYDLTGLSENNSNDWPVKCIKDVCTLKSGNSEANNSREGDLPYVKVGDMTNKGNERFIVSSSQFVDRGTNAKGIFPIGTTIFPKRGGAILTNKKRLTSVEICCDLNIMGVIPDLSIIHPIYLFQYFQSIDLGQLFNGATIPQLNNCDIGPLKIVVPSMAIQESFAERINRIDHLRASIQRSLKDTEDLLDSRMAYYFS